MAYFDLRVPLGWLFVIIGGLLLFAGFTVSTISSDGHPIDLNVNVGWGMVCLVFGVVCLLGAWDQARKKQDRRRTESGGVVE
jgi:UDP-N-acetylmuramyl pentapeptide phosphotransferase/UDP-N-acetylglucosamine-1-phosphate transferase